MIRLFIENTEIELDESVQFAITKQFEDLSNPVKIKNDWSKTVSIPFTARNNGIFGHIYNPDRLIVSNNTSSGTLTGIYFDPYKKLDMRLQWGDDVLMIGYAKMNEIKQVNGKGTYDITLFGQLGKLFQEMEKITFDMSTDDTQYLIDGSQYVSEYINKDLLFQMWNRNGQFYEDLYKKGQEHYNVADIIGFAPNNAFSEGFDYKNVQTSPNESRPFTEILGENFKTATGIDADNVIPDGMLPRGYGEYRSYLQLPFIYWNKLFKIFIEKAESVTGYKCELENGWFNTSNPYWYNLVYMLNPLDVKKEDTYTNTYMFASYGMGWGGDINEYVQPKTTSITFTGRNEAIPIIDNSNMILLSDDYSVIFNTIVTFSLNLGHYNNLRINPANGLQISFLVEDENSNVLDEVKYLMVDNDYSGSVRSYKDVLRVGRQGSGEMQTYPKLDLVLDKGKYGDKVKLVLQAVWLNTNAPFLDNNNNPFTPTPTQYTGYVNFHLYNVPINKPVSCMVVKNRFRSYNHFTLNTLWNNDYKIFNEILKYCQMFRINIVVDEINKKIYFKSFVNYFEETKITDWTSKVDKSKDFIIKPITFENKYVLFNYDDIDSKLFKDYKTKYGLNYGEYKLTTDYNFNNETTKLFSIKITPSITNTDNVLSWTNIYDNHKILYSFPNEIYVYNKDKDNKQVNLFGAFYFYTGLAQFNSEPNLYLRSVYLSDDTDFQGVSSNYCFISTNTEGSKRTLVYNYPALDVVYNGLLCLFNTPMENYTYLNNYGDAKNIYYNLWATYLNERYNIQNKLLTCYVMLKPSDMSNFTWNTFIKIGSQIYIVNKIYDYNITNNEPTKVDLITIQDMNSYNTNNYIVESPLTLSWSTKVYFNGEPAQTKTNLGTYKSLTDVTFSNNNKSITSNGVQFTIEGNDVYAQRVTKYVDNVDIDFNITMKNRFSSVSFECQRYSTYPYPWIIIEDSNGNEVSTIYPGSRIYKFKWHGTETEGLDNKPTITIENHGTGSATIGNDWVENQVMIAEGDDEYFRNEYEVTLNTNMTNYSGTYLRFIVTDKEGWHETRDYYISL